MQGVTLIFEQAHAHVSSLFEDAFRATQLNVEKVTVPSTWMFDRAYVRHLRTTINNAKLNSFTIAQPPNGLFLSEPDLLVPFSAYRSWYNSASMRVIPHLWTPIGLPDRTDELVWPAKPPLNIGFMGRTFRSSAICRLVRSMPFAVKKWLLSGALDRNPSLGAVLNERIGFAARGHNAFARLEAIDVLEKGPLKQSGQVELAERESFTGTKSELTDYRKHLRRNTYELCPRGTENYSYRTYETLAYGRIPVIIDTEIVLPDAINWPEVAVIVPYGDLSRLNEIIIEDYESRSDEQFIERQEKAFAAVQSIHNLGWLRDLVNWVEQRLNGQHSKHIKQHASG